MDSATRILVVLGRRDGRPHRFSSTVCSIIASSVRGERIGSAHWGSLTPRASTSARRALADVTGGRSGRGGGPKSPAAFACMCIVEDRRRRLGA
jgi:hypothetical protein